MTDERDYPVWDPENQPGQPQGQPEPFEDAGYTAVSDPRFDAGDAEMFDDEVQAAEDQPGRTRTSSLPLKDAWKQVENLGQTLGSALQGRGNVVMVRVNNETLRHLDMLVEAEITRSRSESAALLISQGIQANQALFDRIQEVTDEIARLRSELRASIRPDIEKRPGEA